MDGVQLWSFGERLNREKNDGPIPTGDDSGILDNKKLGKIRIPNILYMAHKCPPPTFWSKNTSTFVFGSRIPLLPHFDLKLPSAQIELISFS